MAGRRDLRALPKAHLHLHLTGSMRHATLLELAARAGARLPPTLRTTAPTDLVATDRRGWFRFQRLYDTSRAVLRTPADLDRLVDEAVADDAAEGSVHLELQVDPTGYVGLLGGTVAVVERLGAALGAAGERHGISTALVVAANRTRHEMDARALARLAVRSTDVGVVGFGLSSDERAGAAETFARAFRIARDGGLACVPHGGELAGPGSVRACLDALGADRVGHGVAAARDPALLGRLAAGGVTLEVCPVSNVRLGVAVTAADVPLRTLLDAGVPVALGADDPLLFGARLLDQYVLARDVSGLSDAELAGLARDSLRAARMPEPRRTDALAAVDAWLTAPAGAADGGAERSPRS